ncbi:hypothetical protein ACJX0J_038204, partial [Zea mays]
PKYYSILLFGVEGPQQQAFSFSFWLFSTITLYKIKIKILYIHITNRTHIFLCFIKINMFT